MKILFYGDSITDMGRNYDVEVGNYYSYGNGYVRVVTDNLTFKNPEKYTIINKGISGNRVVDLYARIKRDVWNFEPDVLSIYIGVNDVWHDVNDNPNGVEIDRFEAVYRMLIADTIKRLPNVKIMLVEPFVVKGTKTLEKMDKFVAVYDYAKVVKKLANEFNLPLVEIQSDMDKAVEAHGSDIVCKDGVHPNIYGMNVIAKNWLEVFNKYIDKE